MVVGHAHPISADKAGFSVAAGTSATFGSAVTGATGMFVVGLPVLLAASSVTLTAAFDCARASALAENTTLPPFGARLKNSVVCGSVVFMPATLLADLVSMGPDEVTGLATAT
jgi:hypothetical protein